MVERNPDGHSPKYWKKHPDKAPKAEVQSPESPLPAKRPSKLADFINSPWVVGFALGIFGILGMLFQWVLAIFVLIIVWEFHRTGVVRGRPIPQQVATFVVLVTVLGSVSWMLHRYVLENVVPRAYITTESIRMDVTGGWVKAIVDARTWGAEIPLGIMQVAVVTDTWQQPSELSVLIKRADWRRGGTWIGGIEANHQPIRPGHIFSVSKQYIPGSPDELNDLFASPPKKFLVVLTSTCIKDNWGTRPPDMTCHWFSSEDQFQAARDCLNAGNPLATFWSTMFPKACGIQ